MAGHTTPIIRVFGGMGLDGADGPISIGGSRQRRLLGLLAVRANTVVDIDWLASYDSDGSMIGETEIGEPASFIATLDPESGRLAVALDAGGLVIVDTTTGDVDRLPFADPVGNLGFGPGGDLLAVTSFNGLVRLWDVERRESAGLVWDGEGAVVGSPSWYDPESESMWIFATGKLLQVPLSPERWIEKACQVVGRDLTQEEWDRYVPGDEAPVSACG